MAKKLHQLCWLSMLTAFFWAVAALGIAGEKERVPKRQHGQAVEDPNNARVIVKFRADSLLRQAPLGRAGRPVLTPPQHASTMAALLRTPLTDGRILGLHTQAIRGTGLSTSQLVQRLEALADGDVEWAVEDVRRHISAVPNDPYFGAEQLTTTPTAGQWYLRAPDSTLVSAINAQAAWGIATGSPSVTVAVVDTGVRFEHPDLAGKLYPGYAFVADAAYSKDPKTAARATPTPAIRATRALRASAARRKHSWV